VRQALNDPFRRLLALADMLLNFMTGYTVNNHSVELHHRRIVLRYLKGWCGRGVDTDTDNR
jgi:hypothetical protein